MTVLVVLVDLATVLAATGVAAAWLLPAGPSRDLGTVTMLVGTAVLGLVAAVPGDLAGESEALVWLLPVVLVPVGVLGGSPVTALVLHLADRESTGLVEQAATVLRGGAWIGVFERTAIVATLLAGWPEGIAIVLGLKGLGRYSELRTDRTSDDQTRGAVGGGVAERFIIGTFCSVLWAAGCVGALVGLTG